MSSPKSTQDSQPANHRITPEELLAREFSARTVLFHEAVARRVGLGVTEHKLFDILARAGEPLTAGALAERSGLTTGAITGIVDRLEQAGFVRRERSEEDRRKVYIAPTEQAFGKYGAIMQGVAQGSQQVIAHYSPAEQEIIVDFIRRSVVMLIEEAERLNAPE